MDWLEVVVVVVAVAVGALAQASGGFGIALISGPALVAVDPAFVPVPLMIGGLVVGTRHLVREWNGLDGTFLRQCLIGMPVGVVAGHLATSAFSERGLKVTVGLLVVLPWCLSGWGLLRRVAAGRARCVACWWPSERGWRPFRVRRS